MTTTFENEDKTEFALISLTKEQATDFLNGRPITISITAETPRKKLIHGVEVPDISFEPRENETYYFPFPMHPELTRCLVFDSHHPANQQNLKHKLCYPSTKEGRQAAVLHAKAMLGIKE